MRTLTSNHTIGLVCLSLLLCVPALVDASTYCQVAGSSCLTFDGIDDFVNLGNNPSLQVTGNMSICAWIQLDATNPGQYWGIAGKLTSTSGFYYRGYGLIRFSNNRFRFLTANGVLNTVESTQDYTDTNWHHVTGVLEGGRMKIYVDGVFHAQSGTGMSILDSGQFAFIGRQYSDLAYRFFKGRIDDVRIYNVALTAGQVTTAMTTVPTGPVAGLVGYWNLDEGAGQTVYDLSGNNNHGILGNGTGVDSADPAWYDVSSICPRQRTYYVDAVNGSDSYSGLSPTTAFKTIQKGINVAANGDTVMVLPGQYVGTGNKELDFGGKAITVKAQNGPAATVINCQGSGRAFHFRSGEGPNSVVDGFSITGGNSATGGAIYCVGAGPTISNCWIYGNTTASTSSGIVYCLNNANAVLVGCRIYSNSGASAAVRFNNSAGQIKNCVLFGNTSTSAGGAIRCDNGTRTTTITNCTVVGNSTTSNGGGLWIRTANAQVVNSIFWGNQASAGGHQMSTSSPATLTVNYSNVQGGRPGVHGTGTVVWGTGNIDQDPLFADPANFDYYLKSTRGRYWPAHRVWVLDDVTSPCIDAGDPASPIGDEPQPNGNRINMGAYGGTAYASLSPTGEGGIQGDVNRDGVIDFNDLFALIDMWLNLYAGEIQFLEPI